MSDNKIEIRNLYKAFGKKKVLDGVNLDIKKGESLVVIGGSGTGKSVLIKCIQGLVPRKIFTKKWECFFRERRCLIA